jgi:glycosyltransferase involved in cell wall biosynthesis
LADLMGEAETVGVDSRIADCTEHELAELRTRVRELAGQLALERAHRVEAQATAGLRAEPRPAVRAARRVGADRAAQAPMLGREPGPGAVRAALAPAHLLDGLGWPGSEDELGLPIPVDHREVLASDAPHRLEIVAGEDPVALRGALCSVLERVTQPVALSVLLPDTASAAMLALARNVALAEPEIAFTRRSSATSERLNAGDQLTWGWPKAIGQSGLPRIAYLLPGIAAEGSGGSHSVVQEVRGLRGLGAEAHVCVSAASLETAQRLYGADERLFEPYFGPAEVEGALRDAHVVVANEHTSVDLLARLARADPERSYAYYVQDYEPLFAELRSPRSDRALLSYRAVPGALLFAKTYWLANVVAALHGVPVVKVTPSLDTELFHSSGRGDQDAPLRVLAMVRPRTPRRRPRATLAALALIGDALGDRVELVTFGCEIGELDGAGLQLPRRVRHLGPLRREEVAEQLRRTDVFVDLSAYQAFGRTGIEAMACGAVPVLPQLGGVSEYARHLENALVIDNEPPIATADAVVKLAHDRSLLHRLRATGVPQAARFTIERAAASQLSVFAAAREFGVDVFAGPLTRP